MSYNTLLRRLKQYGLKRRGMVDEETFNDKFLKVQRRLTELISGSCSSFGYRSIWHILELEGLRVPRVIVQDLLKEMDPEGTELRRKHCLKRRMYQNPGPNYAWHIDCHDKLKAWGFPIHGAIHGFSRKILWLEVTRSNNSPHKIAAYYARTVSKVGGCPVEVCFKQTFPFAYAPTLPMERVIVQTLYCRLQFLASGGFTPIFL